MKKIIFALTLSVIQVASSAVTETEAVASILGDLKCDKHALGINGGVGENCLGGFLTAVVVTPEKVLLESSSAEASKQAFQAVSKKYKKVLRVSDVGLVIAR